MIRTVLLSLLLILTCTAATCPPPKPGESGIYAKAYLVIDGLEGGALGLASATFNVWCAFADVELCAAKRPLWEKIRLDVLDGLETARAAVQAAESLGQSFDLFKLMFQAENAWQKLRKFLDDLGVPVSSSLPTKDRAPASAKLTDRLPKTLLPERQ